MLLELVIYNIPGSFTSIYIVFFYSCKLPFADNFLINFVVLLYCNIALKSVVVFT